MKRLSLRSFGQRGSLHYILPLAFITVFAVIGAGVIVYSHAASGNCPDPGGTEAQKIANTAKYEYCIWNGGKNWKGSHVSQTVLMSLYTDGTPKEAWCADFVSYVYKAAGSPFTRGTNGWDEKASSQIVNMNGLHKDKGGHKPQVGDIAYFFGNDYPAGHVEIVVSINPVKFIYGNSGTNDPATGNGEMAEDSYVSPEIQYYLSPN